MSIANITVFFKTILTFLTSVIVSLSALFNPTPGATAEAKIIDEKTFGLVDALVTGQGLATDGEYYYASGSLAALNLSGLAKIDMDTGEIIMKNLSAIPSEFAKQNYDHIGAITYGNGYIYAPLECEDDSDPLVLLYNPETLEYTGTYYEMDNDETYLDDGIPWCAVDENYLYTSQFHGADFYVVYNIDDMSFSHIQYFSEPMDRIQSAECYNGTLYLNCDPKTDTKKVYECNPDTGDVNLLFNRKTTGYDTETEGMCITGDENGNPLFHIVDYNKIISTFIRTYTLK